MGLNQRGTGQLREMSSRGKSGESSREGGAKKRKRKRTKLPANPPAINATPINKITLALHAAGPSDPHASPENAEWR